MRRIVLVSGLALLVTGASAQVRGGGVRGGGHGGIEFRPAFRGGRSGQLPGRRYGYLPYGYAGGYGYAGDDLGYGASPYEFPAAPMFSEPAAPAVAAIPVAPAHPVLTNYTWPAATAPTSAPAAEDAVQAFGIVLKDGSVLTATTVFAAEDGLHYVDPDERHMRVAMDAVDRAATLKLNRERKLDLYLPASSR